MTKQKSKAQAALETLRVILIWICGPLLLLFIVSYYVLDSMETHNLKSRLPEQIEVGRKVQSYTQFIATPGGSCGGAFFTLEAKTRQKIYVEKENFFSGAKISRSGKFRYVWHETEAPNRGLFGAVGCALGVAPHNKEYWVREQKFVGDMSSDSGNYFAAASDGYTHIAVFLDKDIVFVGHWD